MEIIDEKLINDLTLALNHSKENNIYVDILLFSKQKDDIINKLKSIEEIKRQPILYKVWEEILNEC